MEEECTKSLQVGYVNLEVDNHFVTFHGLEMWYANRMIYLKYSSLISINVFEHIRVEWHINTSMMNTISRCMKGLPQMMSHTQNMSCHESL